MKEKNSEPAPQESSACECLLDAQSGCDRTAEPERERSVFSMHTKLCITVVPSTTHTHRRADKGRIRRGAPSPVVTGLGR